MPKRDFSHLIQLVAWVSIVVIAYATLTRVGFVYSIYLKLAPYLMHIGMSKYAAAEHFVAFAIFGALFSVAYPNHVVTVFCFVFGMAIALELAQTLTPDRHGTVIDALQKISGGAFGILVVTFARKLFEEKA